MGLETVRELFLFCFYLSVPLHPPLKGIAALFGSGVSDADCLHSSMIDLLHGRIGALTSLRFFVNQLSGCFLLRGQLDCT